jgi:chloride channel 3/4/5
VIQAPCGSFVPLIAIGACYGKVFGILLENATKSVNNNWCIQGNECFVTSAYALMGAAAMLSGTMRMTISLLVIVVELTGELTYVAPSKHKEID